LAKPESLIFSFVKKCNSPFALKLIISPELDIGVSGNGFGWGRSRSLHNRWLWLVGSRAQERVVLSTKKLSYRKQQHHSNRTNNHSTKRVCLMVDLDLNQ